MSGGENRMGVCNPKRALCLIGECRNWYQGGEKRGQPSVCLYPEVDVLVQKNQKSKFHDDDRSIYLLAHE